MTKKNHHHRLQDDNDINNNDSPWLLVVVAITLTAMAMGSWVFLSKGKTTPTKKKNPRKPTPRGNDKGACHATTTTINNPSKNNNKNNKNTTNLPVLDVWEERRKRGITPASLNHKGGAETTKPFGSSYYYAHNNPNTSGGYKDGLRMEDYTMNAPRLLSKGGKAVLDNQDTVSTDTAQRTTKQNDSATAAITATITATTPDVPSIPTRRQISITQYLWDDEGGKTATILIDKLPGKVSTDPTLPLSVTAIDNVTAKLTNDNRGLHVVVYTPKLDWDYQLLIQPLFATAESVQAMVKPKRLRIRLVKKSSSNSQMFLSSSTYEKWPHAHKKKT